MANTINPLRYYKVIPHGILWPPDLIGKPTDLWKIKKIFATT
jgi:hypothetical protein